MKNSNVSNKIARSALLWIALSVLVPVAVALVLPSGQALLAVLALTIPFFTMAALEKSHQEPLAGPAGSPDGLPLAGPAGA